MTDLDKKIKEYAKQEQMLVPEGFEKRIDNVIDNISKKGIRLGLGSKMLKPSFIAATISMCLLLACGVVYASGIISRFDVDWNGSKIRTYNDEERPNTPYPMAEGYVPESADEYAFRQIENQGEIRRIGSIQKDGLFSERFASGINGKINSISELQKLLREADVPLLKLPSYIPKGYQLETIRVSYYLSPKLIDPYMAPTEVLLSKNGNQMQIFKLPDGYKKYVDSYQITLKNSNGSYLDIIGDFSENYDSTTFNIMPNTTVSNPVISGFPKSIYFSNSLKDGDSTIISTIISVEQKMDAVQAYSVDELDYNNREKKAKPAANTYNNIFYQITATNDLNINESEMVQMINSLNAVQ